MSFNDNRTVSTTHAGNNSNVVPLIPIIAPQQDQPVVKQDVDLPTTVTVTRVTSAISNLNLSEDTTHLESVAQVTTSVQFNPSLQSAEFQNLAVTALYDDARRAFENGDYLTCERLCTLFRRDNPRNTDALLLLGLTHFRCGSLDISAALYNIALHINPNLAEAHFNLGNIFKAKGHLAEALIRYQRAVDIQPNFVAALYGLARTLGEVGNKEYAMAIYKRILVLQPQDLIGLLEVGRLFESWGNLKSAEEWYSKCLAIDPGCVNAWNYLGRVHREQKNYWIAIHHFSQAIELNSSYLEAYINLSVTFKNAKILEKARATLLDAMLRLKPEGHSAFQILFLLGSVYREMGQLDHAIKAFNEALEIDRNAIDVYSSLGDCYMDKGFQETAKYYYDQAFTINPQHTGTLTGLGIVSLKQNDFNAARQLCEQAVSADPTFITGRLNLAKVAVKAGNLQEAIHQFLNILDIQPLTIPASIFSDKFPAECYARMIWCQQMICDWDRYHNYQTKIENLLKLTDWELQQGRPLSVRPNEALHYPEWNDEDRLKIAKSHAKHIYEDNMKILKRSPFEHSQATLSAPLKRIGFLSRCLGDANNHTSRLLAYILMDHQRNGWEVFCYMLEIEDDPAIRSLVPKPSDGFPGLKIFACAELMAQKINQDGIQMLVDLDGYQSDEFGSMRVLALKPAPVQVLWTLDYLGTSGATYVDFLLTDEVVMPGTQKKEFTEGLAQSQKCCYVGCHKLAFPDLPAPVGNWDETVEKRKELGLPVDRNAIVFCNFEQCQKLEPDLMQVWLNILERVPGSVLWLQRPEFDQGEEANILKMVESRGIPEKAIVFGVQNSEWNERLKDCQLADIYLDTLTHNGNHSVLDAIWAGLPVITCKSDKSAAGRMTASRLKCLGVPELITTEKKEYENLAVELATNREYRKEVANIIWQARDTSDLFDLKGYIPKVELYWKLLWIIKTDKRCLEGVAAS